jgi:hypothetical protein
MDYKERLNDMLERYGECCTQERAARILGKCSRTIRRMLDDGRLTQIRDGVDVRSIASYIINPVQHDYAARLQKRK